MELVHTNDALAFCSLSIFTPSKTLTPERFYILDSTSYYSYPSFPVAASNVPDKIIKSIFL